MMPSQRTTRVPFWRWLQPWYIAFLLLGLTTGGIAAILIPLGLIRSGSATAVGGVSAIIGAGQLSAGFWGTLADRRRAHTLVFGGGMLAVVAAFSGFALQRSVVGWALLALLLGAGTAAANTVANLFVVEEHPQAEWSERISWLQTFYSAGVVAGTLLASVLTHLPLRAGLLVAAGLTALGALLGWLLGPGPAADAHACPSASRLAHDLVTLRLLQHPRIEFGSGGPLRHLHYPTVASVRRLKTALRSQFGVFLLSWLSANLGISALYTLYPILMRRVFGIAPGSSSVVLAAGSGLGLLLYAPAGAAQARVGAARVLQSAFAARLLGLVVFGLLGAASFPGREWLAAGSFLVVALGAPLMGVSSTVLTSQLSVKTEGEGLGLYNATNAFAGLCGSLAGGVIADRAGYNAVTLLAAATVALSLALALLVRAPEPQPHTPTQ